MTSQQIDNRGPACGDNDRTGK